MYRIVEETKKEKYRRDKYYNSPKAKILISQKISSSLLSGQQTQLTHGSHQPEGEGSCFFKLHMTSGIQQSLRSHKQADTTETVWWKTLVVFKPWLFKTSIKLETENYPCVMDNGLTNWVTAWSRWLKQKTLELWAGFEPTQGNPIGFQIFFPSHIC